MILKVYVWKIYLCTCRCWPESLNRFYGAKELEIRGIDWSCSIVPALFFVFGCLVLNWWRNCIPKLRLDDSWQVTCLKLSLAFIVNCSSPSFLSRILEMSSWKIFVESPDKEQLNFRRFVKLAKYAAIEASHVKSSIEGANILKICLSITLSLPSRFTHSDLNEFLLMNSMMLVE